MTKFHEEKNPALLIIPKPHLGNAIVRATLALGGLPINHINPIQKNSVNSVIPSTFPHLEIW
jgi:hypothetical protein